MAANRNPVNTTQISDKQLARIALGYLKMHYKYRKRKGESITQLDAKSASGLIADGYLRFAIDEDTDFVATVEATDYWHRDELWYRHTIDLLVMDSIAVSLVATVVGLGFFYFNGAISAFHLGWASSILLLLLVTLLLAGLVFALLWPRPRYRYIYAVEQFKEYYADDQWVIFSFDVFPNYEDKYYKELRRQCIRYGFGLLEVDANRNVKVLLAAAREDAVKSNRGVVEFKGIAAMTQSISIPNLPALRRSGKTYFNWRTDLLRFRRTYYNQLAIIATCLFLIGGLIYEESQKGPVNYVDEAEYVDQQQLLKRDLAQQKASEGIFYFKIDSGIFVRRSKYYMAPSIVYDLDQEPITLATSDQSIISVYSGGTFDDVPCGQYMRQSNNRYLVFFASYYQLDEAKRAAIQLRNNGIPANVAWANCFFQDRPFYLVFYEYLFINADRAEERIRSLAAELRRNQLVYEMGYSRISQ